MLPAHADDSGMGALGDLLGTMRQMESVLSRGSGGASAAPREPSRADQMAEASRMLSEGKYAQAADAFGAMLARDRDDESAQRGLRQAEKGLQLEQQMALEEWFSGLGLQHFAWPMAEQGFVTLSQLQVLSDVELRAAVEATGMGAADAKVFGKALGGRRACGGAEGGASGLGGMLAAAPGVGEDKARSPSTAGGPPRGLLSRSQSNSSTPIASWLGTWQLASSVGEQLQQLGVETVGDLQALSADDIADVRRPLKKIQAKKFIDALGQALDDIEREMVDQELNRAHEEAGRLRREHAAVRAFLSFYAGFYRFMLFFYRFMPFLC